MKAGENMEFNESYQPGEIVFIIIRNPHAQNVANVQQAAVVENPDKPGEPALFIHETYYPITDEVAIFQTEEEAEQVFQQTFGTYQEGGFYG